MEDIQFVKLYSPHLFWDTDRNTLDLGTHKNYIIKQVLEYGYDSDCRGSHSVRHPFPDVLVVCRSIALYPRHRNSSCNEYRDECSSSEREVLQLRSREGCVAVGGRTGFSCRGCGNLGAGAGEKRHCL